MTTKTFTYLAAASFGSSFTYFTLGYDAQAIVMVIIGVLALGAAKLFNR